MKNVFSSFRDERQAFSGVFFFFLSKKFKWKKQNARKLNSTITAVCGYNVRGFPGVPEPSAPLHNNQWHLVPLSEQIF